MFLACILETIAVQFQMVVGQNILTNFARTMNYWSEFAANTKEQKSSMSLDTEFWFSETIEI